MNKASIALAVCFCLAACGVETTSNAKNADGESSLGLTAELQTELPENVSSLIQGQITNSEGAPIKGVMVRLQDTDTLLAETVYTNALGRFALPTNLSGPLEVRTRVPYHADQSVPVSFEEKAILNLDFELREMRSDREISDSLPSVFHFNLIEFDEDPDSVLSRNSFQRDCAGCHQFGNEFTRRGRDETLWSPTIARMHAYLGNLDEDITERRSQMLDMSGPYGGTVMLRPEFPVDKEIFSAKVYEYPLEYVAFPHDAEISQNDGKSYAVDRHGHSMVITNLETGENTFVDMPPPSRGADADGNGYTSRSGDPGPHSLALGKDNLWYTTNATSDEIGVFDATTQTWRDSFVLPEPARYPHTIRIDKQNIVWFTLAVSDQIGRLDPSTGEVDLIGLPKVTPIGIAGGPSPYGIDVNPVDGTIWYARLYGDVIGFVDPETLEVTEYESPVRGPRRLRFNKAGELWLTGYTEGMIAHIKTQTMDITVHKMPEFELDHRPAPYALAIHPETQDVWINETMTDRVYRFIPGEARFISYPMPLRGTYTRDFSFTQDGLACTANSPIMNVALEGGIANLICIDPDMSLEAS
ncbi:MAG: carboxypeptidase regulatory-like domain-containing protein [Henriciella sp.]